MKSRHLNLPAIRHLTAMATCFFLTVSFLARGVTSYYWYSVGPQPVETLLGFNNDTLGYNVEADCGRVTALAVDPSKPLHWLVGTAQGGVWENTNAGPFYPRTDDQASLAVGAIAFAPGDPSLVYAGTGEANFRGDDYAGAGLLVSRDGGTHWQMLNTNFARTSFSHIVVDPANGGHLAAATTRGGAGIREESSGDILLAGAPPRGVYVSSDGGTNFTRVLTGEATALVANANNFSDQYAGLGAIHGDPANGVYRTRNGWQTSELISGPWVQIIPIYTNFPIATNFVINCSNGPPCTTNLVVTYTNILTGSNIVSNGRIAMAISATYPNVLYVGVAGLRTNYWADLQGIWMTTNAWADSPTWTELTPPPLYTVYPSESIGVDLPRFWYMFDLLVDPNDPTMLYLAEYDVWRYASGGWTSQAEWSVNNVHPDNHVMAWMPKGGSSYSMLLGNDGGLYISDPGVSGYWTSLNSGLRITQFYKGAVDPTGQNVLALGGAQDNFTSLYTGSTAWTVVGPGDGGDCAIAGGDPLNDWAMSYQTDTRYGQNYADILRTLNGGKDANDASGDITDTLPISDEFYVHFEKAPYNDNLLLAGTARLWRCTNFFSGIPAWTPNSPTQFDAGGNPIPISAMAFAPADTNGLIYAFGTEDGQLYITYSGGAQWSNLDPTHQLPGRYVSGLAFSPADVNTLYVTLSGFDEDTPSQPGHLFKTAGALSGSPTWTDVSPPVDLPNDCLAIDPGNAANIFVGTDLGVWQSLNGGGLWTHYGPANGMPNVAVYDLRFNAQSQLTAFTHGRGAYLLASINVPIINLSNIRNIHPIVGCLTCPPDQAFLNPGDQESVDIPLQGILPIDTVDLTATMMPSAAITPINGTQDYGVVKGQGPAVSRTFTFIAGGSVPGPAGPGGASCGDTVQVVLQLQDQGMNLGQVSIPFHVGIPSHPLVEDFEEGPPPGLSPGWTSGSVGADAPWVTVTNPPVNIPDAGEDQFPTPPSTNTSAFVSDAARPGQSYLISPPFNVATPQAQLYFRGAFATSNTFDGCILEIAIGTQPFQEITQAGGLFVEDGYNAVLSDRNPLGPRHAWSGNSGGWLPIVVNLPPTAAGQTVQLRWRFASSVGLAQGGWFVDSVLVTEPLCLPPVSNPLILNPAVSGGFFKFAINTVTNRGYIIEFKTNLADPAWQTLETIPGNGSQQVISVPIGPDQQRFYRFEVQ
jgi:hypothetical protein